ncbi:MAG: hypothetical protein JSV32_01945 [Dehalococcoidia bacterium]|nr:MAG: hypothetical protein JSV32_01945 [Dehalococcoidia bacterium]
MRNILKKVLLVTVIFGLLVTGISCNEQPSQQTETPTTSSLTVGGMEAERYNDTYHGYTILYPKDWTVKSTDEHTMEIRGSIALITIEAAYYSSDPLSEYVSQVRSIYEKSLGYEILSRGDIVEGDTSEACLDVVTSGDVLASLAVTTMEEHLYMKAKPEGWVLRVILSCDIQAWEDNKPIFEDIITSFKLLD